jgi:hypothetical protein
VLFDALHAEHEEVDQKLGELLTTDDAPRAKELWKTVAVALAVHARAEQDAVYDVLERDQEDAIKDARQEHEDIEDLLADADAAIPGTEEFYGFIAEIRDLVKHHVEEEEGTILPKARATVHDDERKEMVAMFRELEDRLRPKVEAEFSGVTGDVGEEGEVRAPQGRARRGRRVKAA